MTKKTKVSTLGVAVPKSITRKASAVEKRLGTVDCKLTKESAASRSILIEAMLAAGRTSASLAASTDKKPNPYYDDMLKISRNALDKESTRGNGKAEGGVEAYNVLTMIDAPIKSLRPWATEEGGSGVGKLSVRKYQQMQQQVWLTSLRKTFESIERTAAMLQGGTKGAKARTTDHNTRQMKGLASMKRRVHAEDAATSYSAVAFVKLIDQAAKLVAASDDAITYDPKA